MAPTTRYQLWYGRDEPPVERRALRAGPVALELEGIDLRYARVGAAEVMRRLYVAIRDRNWNTIPPEVTGLEVEDGADRFAVRFEARNREDEVDFRWRASIEGEPDGTITAELDGVAETDFRYNRIGFCLHHPPRECAGRPYRTRTPDGATAGELPVLVGPQLIRDGTLCPLLPAYDELEIELDGGLTVRFALAGDLFEMEDQRNWTDGSYKTYSTPLGLGFPHEARAGQAIRQRVAMSLSLPGGGAAGQEQPRPRLAAGGPLPRRLPPIGLGLASHGGALSAREVELLRSVSPDHLRADLRLGEPGWRGELERGAREAARLGAALELALFLTDDAERQLDELAEFFPLGGAEVVRFLVFHEAEMSTGARWLRLARERLAGSSGGVPVVGGTNAYFCELNRGRPDPDTIDGVAFSINPQVHASDEASIVETAQAQADAVRSAEAFSAGKPVVVSPVTLLPRFNPNATEPEREPEPGELPSQVDPRQMSLFAAAWTVASAKYLAESGAGAITYYETTGWRGLLEREAGSPLPERFPSQPGMAFPVYHALADLAARTGDELVALESSQPLAVDGLALRSGGSLLIVVAGLVPTVQQVVLEGLPDGRASLRRLNETTAESALADPTAFRAAGGDHADVEGGLLELELAPFEVVRIDLEHA